MVTVNDLAQPSSGDATIDALLNQGPGWNYLVPERTTLTYAFAESDVASSVSSYVESPFTTAQRAAADDILAYTTQVTGIVFQEVSSASDADIVFANTGLSGTTAGLTVWGSSYYYVDTPGTTDDEVTQNTIKAFVYMDDSGVNYIDEMDPGDYGYLVLLHEMGHALGLKHPGHYESDDYPPYLSEAEDSTDYTIMSYNQGSVRYPSTFQVYDIAALDWLYGGDGLGGVSGLIADDSAPVYAIRATSASDAEGDSGSTDFVFTVSRTGDVSDSVTLEYTFDGSGTNPADFEDFYGPDAAVVTMIPQVTFAAGQSTATIAIPVYGDLTVEEDETFTVTLLEPASGSLGTASATGTILNDDVEDGAVDDEPDDVIVPLPNPTPAPSPTTTKVFFDANGSFVVADVAQAIGGSGSETLYVLEGAQVTADANLERVELPGTLASYLCSVSGSSVTLVAEDDGESVTFSSLNQPATIAFADGSAALTLTGVGSASLGGVALGATPAVVAASLDATDPSNDAVGLGFVPDAGDTGLYLGSGETVSLYTDATVAGSFGLETLLVYGAPEVTLDANIERVELAETLDSYTFQVSGTTISVLLQGAEVLRFTGLNQETTLAFADGAADLALTGVGQATLGGVALPATAGAVAVDLDTDDVSQTTVDIGVIIGNEDLFAIA